MCTHVHAHAHTYPNIKKSSVCKPYCSLPFKGKKKPPEKNHTELKTTL